MVCASAWFLPGSRRRKGNAASTRTIARGPVVTPHPPASRIPRGSAPADQEPDSRKRRTATPREHRKIQREVTCAPWQKRKLRRKQRRRKSTNALETALSKL